MPLHLPAGRRPGTDARGSQSYRPLLIVLALFVVVFVAIYGPIFFASWQTRGGVRLAVQEKCGLSSAAVAGEPTIDLGTAWLPYVDSTGAHTAIVYIGEAQTYFVHTCGR